MILSYRARRFFKGLAIAGLVLLLLLVLVWGIWLLWLDRYVVYTSDGAILDFSSSNKTIAGEVAYPPEEDVSITIYYNEGDNTINISTELAQVAGYYIDAAMLENEMSLVMSQLRKLPPQTPVMVEVKDIVGRFFYSTNLGPIRSSINTADIEQLFNFLRLSELYTIAYFPSLRDYYYGLNHVSDGIFLRSGKGLWMDDQRCYWLSPDRQGTQAYLIQIITELKLLGFNEVVLGDFSVPVSDGLKFSGSRNEALSAAAKNIIDACGTDRFAISFCVTDASFTLPAGRTRIFMKDLPASEIKTQVTNTTLADPVVGLVFITDANDTRFDEYGVLRPLTTAQLEE